ncbi:hypothetical protein, variant [Sphaeroforma arctica JP610]|uniref:CST complex subunit CTC1 n=1 Tax=Sphaeroforma arctica JP610 TaxID=667725 RepID=A0A0L0GBA6_9EUKA|nr:hypothetical protein, variant [Sphaeroforma arctica JP610]KNC86184.1 hypothetical protein, variant [Sphaeroforma arctica JP610]|eukprot:XP_014160087.1 hypothetical protein, variant [Sphaeroforma arctica JP610]
MKCARCPKSIVLFEGGDQVHWRSFLHIGKVCLVTCLQRKRLYELPILEAQSAKELFLQRTGTVVLSGLLYPALETYEPYSSGRHGPHDCSPDECLNHGEVPTVSYLGQISHSESMSHRIYSLDHGKLYLFLTHQEATKYGRGFRVGASVKVHNAHPIFDATSRDTRTLVGLACCSYSSVVVCTYSDIPDAPFVPTLPQRDSFSAFPMISSVRDYLWAFRASLVLSLKFQGIFRVKGCSFEGLRIPNTNDEPYLSADIIASNDIRRVIDWFMRLPPSTRARLLGLVNKLLKATKATTNTEEVDANKFAAYPNGVDSEEEDIGGVAESTSSAQKVYQEFINHNTRGACTLMRLPSTPMPSIRFIREVCSVRVLQTNAMVDVSDPNGDSGRYRIYRSEQIFNTLEASSVASGFVGKDNSVLVYYLRYSSSLRCLKMSDCDKDAIDVIVPGLEPESLRCLFALRKFYLVIEDLPEDSRGVADVLKYIYAAKEDVLQLTKSGKRKVPSATADRERPITGKQRVVSNGRIPIDAEIMILNKHETSKVLGSCESYATAVVLHSNITATSQTAHRNQGRGRGRGRPAGLNPPVTVQLTLLGKGEENFPFLVPRKHYRLTNARTNAILPSGDSWVIDDFTVVESMHRECVSHTATDRDSGMVRLSDTVLSHLDELYDVRHLLNASTRLADFVSVRGIVKERIFVAAEDPNDTSETVKVRLADIASPLEVMDVYVSLQTGRKKILMGLIPGSTVCFERVHARVSRKGNLYAHFKALSNITVQALPVADTHSPNGDAQGAIADQVTQKGVIHYGVDPRTGKNSILPQIQPAVNYGDYDKWLLKDFLLSSGPTGTSNEPSDSYQHASRVKKAVNVQNRPHLVWCFINTIQHIKLTHGCVTCGQTMRITCLVCQENHPGREGDKGLLRCSARVFVEDGTSEAVVLFDDPYDIFNHVLRLSTAQQSEIMNLTRKRGSLELFAKDLNSVPNETNKGNRDSHFWNGREHAKEARSILGDLKRVHRHITLLCVLVSSHRDSSEKDQLTTNYVPYDVLLCDEAENSIGKDSESKTEPQMNYDLKKIYIAKDVYIDTRKGAQLVLRPLGVHQTSATNELRSIMNDLVNSGSNPC